MNSGKASPVPFVILGVLVGLLGFFLLLANPFGWQLPLPSLIKSPASTSTPPTDLMLPPGVVKAPTPYLFLPHGVQTYNIRGGEDKVARISRVVYSPLDPKVGTTQTITATSLSREPVSTISLTVNTDNQTNVYPMIFNSGTKENGVWSASFPATDTYEKIYNVSFEIISELGHKVVQPMPLR